MFAPMHLDPEPPILLDPERGRAIETLTGAVDWPHDLVKFRPLIADCKECGSQALLVGIPELPRADRELVDEALERLGNLVSELGVEVYPTSGAPAPPSWTCNNCSHGNIVLRRGTPVDSTRDSVMKRGAPPRAELAARRRR